MKQEYEVAMKTLIIYIFEDSYMNESDCFYLAHKTGETERGLLLYLLVTQLLVVEIHGEKVVPTTKHILKDI